MEMDNGDNLDLDADLSVLHGNNNVHGNVTFDGQNYGQHPNQQGDPIAALESLQHSLGNSWNPSINPYLNQSHAQMLPPSGFVLPVNTQAQWMGTPVPDWAIIMNNPAVAGSGIGMSSNTVFDVAGQYEDCASIAHGSHCDGGCVDQCGECADPICCYNDSCAGIDAEYSVYSACCFDESCGIQQEPCLNEDCHEALHPCHDANCMVPTVSTTPASRSVPTPPTFESDPMITSPVDGANDMDSLIEWHGLPDAKPEPNSMNEEDQFKCRWVCAAGTVCPASFQNHKDLQSHCKDEHLKNLEKGEGGYTCQWHACSRNTPFSQKSKLERHMQTHTGFKPVKCDICGLLLSAKQSLEQHKRTHSGEKPWKCKFPGCTQSFKQQSALTMHTRTHTGEKPLSCEICGKRFGESSNLSKHRRTHNVRGGHFCELCGKDFHRLDQLRRHLKSNHRIGIEKVSEESTENAKATIA